MDYSNKVKLGVFLGSLALTSGGCGNGFKGYIPDRMAQKNGWEKQEHVKRDDSRVNFSTPYLRSWEQKYIAPPYDTLGGLRGHEATRERLKYEFLGNVSQLEGRYSSMWNLFNLLKTKDVVKDSSDIQILYDRAFNAIAPSFGGESVLEEKFEDLSEYIRNDRRIYPNPNYEIRSENQLFKAVLHLLDKPLITEPNDSLLVADFGSNGTYVFVEGIVGEYRYIANPSRELMSRLDPDAKYLANVMPSEAEVSSNKIEVAREYMKNIEQKVNVKRNDTLQAKALHVVLPYIDSNGLENKLNNANSVRVDANWLLFLDGLGLKDLDADTLSFGLECLVTNAGSGDTVFYNTRNEILAGDFSKIPKDFPLRMSLKGDKVHEIEQDFGSGEEVSYKVSTRLSAKANGTSLGEKVDVTYHNFPKDLSKFPVWDMQRITSEGAYFYNQSVEKGDSLSFVIPIGGSYFSNKDSSFKSVVDVFWYPDSEKSKRGEEVLIDGGSFYMFDSRDSTWRKMPSFETQKEKGFVCREFAGDYPSYFANLKFRVPESLNKGKGEFVAKVRSVNSTGQIEDMCSATWRGIIK